MKKSTQTGFGTVEAIVAAVIVLALAGVGFWVYKEQTKDNQSQASSGESVEAPATTQVDTAEDLNTVDNSLDSLNLEAGTSDNAELDSQNNAF